jgi:hypothetical protein
MLAILNGGEKVEPPPSPVPTIGFSIPPPTTQQIVDGRPLWRSLSEVAAETEQGRKEKAFADRYAMTPIPEPDLHDEWGFGL